MELKRCADYQPWRDHSDLLEMDECIFVIPQAGYYCSCVDNHCYNSPCIFEHGTPPEKGKQDGA